MKYIILVLFSSVWLSPLQAQDSIRYQVNKEGLMITRELKAIVGEKDTVLITEAQDICFAIYKKADFNHDGYTDVLVEIINGCGGNCCGNSFKIFSYDGQKFQETDAVGYEWDEIEINKIEGEYQFVISTTNEGIGNVDICQDKTETFRLNGHKWEVIKTVQSHEVEALAEIKAEMFEGQENITKYLTYDLDNDGGIDSVACTYWGRWGRIGSWMITFSNGTVFTGQSTPKRIGVLENSTNGVHDLVLDCDIVIQWKGTAYQENE